MQNNFLDPILGSSTKSAIIECLTEKPLTLKELCSKVEKTTTEMIEAGILQKNEKELMINKEWVEKIKDRFDKIISDSNKPPAANQAKIHYLNNYSEFAKFIIDAACSQIGKDNTPGICIMKHSWPGLGLEEEYIQKMNKFLKSNTYYDVTESSTPLDYAFAKTLEKMGKKIIVGSKLSYPYDMVCKGDTILQIIFEKNFSKDFHKIYEKYTQLDENAINDILQKIVSRPTTIQIIQSTNKKFAEEIRRTVLQEYAKVNKNNAISNKNKLQYIQRQRQE